MSQPDPESIVQQMVVVTRKVTNLFDSRVREAGFTLTRARAVILLARATEPPTQSELADAMEVERPTMARIIDGLERCGLVERRVMDGDRRVRRIVLTDAAESQAKAMLDLTHEVRRDVLGGVDPADIEATRRVLDRMLANMAA
ncbi:MarR family winged helix-turn-helix transcriptional regulator [Acuticoccus sediminis]|uniref:MarR family winged helix-turn-helix transcriptional regulator n=1 Tax=Acuticoccus sediminis TaxID=2184697 RepID=UPI001CFD0DF7|nr:MarR family transcriptional regulator [Acuticoccus sediminis]